MIKCYFFANGFDWISVVGHSFKREEREMEQNYSGPILPEWFYKIE